MNTKEKLKLLSDCLKRNKIAIVLFVFGILFGFGTFILYRLELEPFLYFGAICFTVLAVFLLCDYLSSVKRATEWQRLTNSITSEWMNLPEPLYYNEKRMKEAIETLGRATDEIADACENERRDMLDYYTSWVHQIKTPLAVLNLRLNESTDGMETSAELFKIEQYVDMALNYLRLGSETNDLLIREYSLDSIIRECVRKFAQLFILRKIKLNYIETDAVVITDKKWFCCILEQYISNAIKYTPSGEILIYEKDGMLVVEDSGIGISSEDVPRIFEKGYTGVNGRLGEKSSGLGLYLCKKAAAKLSLPLSCESEPGKGSKFSIGIEKCKKTV